MQLAKQNFPPVGAPHDEFGQSLIESIWIKHAEIPKSDIVAQESFRNTLKPIVGLLVEKQVVSGEDLHLLLESDLLISFRQTRLDENGFKRMAS